MQWTSPSNKHLSSTLLLHEPSTSSLGKIAQPDFLNSYQFLDPGITCS